MTARTTQHPRPRHDPPHGPARARTGRSIIDQGRRTSWRVIGSIGGAILLAAVITTVVVVTGHDSPASSGEVMPAAVTGDRTAERAPRSVADDSGIPGVLAWDTQGWPGDGSSHPGAVQHDHVPGPVTYTEQPPIGGPHNGTWLNAGIYDQPVPSERAVHDMEHGAVWITYDRTLPASEVQALRTFYLAQTKLPEQTESGTALSSRYIVMSPWRTDTLPTPIVVSSWGHQLRVTSAADARLQRFVDTFRSSGRYTPEHGEMVNGVPVSVGGRPLAG